MSPNYDHPHAGCLGGCHTLCGVLDHDATMSFGLQPQSGKEIALRIRLPGCDVFSRNQDRPGRQAGGSQRLKGGPTKRRGNDCMPIGAEPREQLPSAWKGTCPSEFTT